MALNLTCYQRRPWVLTSIPKLVMVQHGTKPRLHVTKVVRVFWHPYPKLVMVQCDYFWGQSLFVLILNIWVLRVLLQCYPEVVRRLVKQCSCWDQSLLVLLLRTVSCLSVGITLPAAEQPCQGQRVCLCVWGRTQHSGRRHGQCK